MIRRSVTLFNTVSDHREVQYHEAFTLNELSLLRNKMSRTQTGANVFVTRGP